jgi:transcription initiation factor TFIIF subunit alpha
VSAFVEKKRPVVRKPATAPQRTVPINQANINQQPPQVADAGSTSGSGLPQTSEPHTDYAVFISKKDIEEGMRYHGFKFNVRVGEDKQVPTIDPYDPSQFTRPVRLHRRYARDKQETGQPSDAPPGVDDKERELYNARRAERQAEREANQALIAPTGTLTKKAQGKKKNQKVVEDVYYNESNPRQQKAAQLRYEETKPWHLEDYDSKNTWIGTYQEPMSSSSVLLTVDIGVGGFNMTPIERWYKFTPTNRLDTMNAEEAEKYMSAGVKPDRWFLKTQVGQEEAKQQEVKVKRERMNAMKKAELVENEGYAAVKDEGEFYNPDKDDLDFEFNDEFQDDDEGAMFGNLEEDEAKDIERRIREEMRGANISAPGLKNTELDFDEEETRQKMEERAQRKREKRMKKQLIKKERKMEYEDDSDENPYSESSDSEDSDEERERLETERKEEEERKAAALANGDKSGASTKGSNTPSGRAEKKDHSRLTANLKRPGSPNLSDASGTESRKKAKGTNGQPLPNGALSRKYPSDPSHPYQSLTSPFSRRSQTAPHRLRIRQRDRVVSSQAQEATPQVSTRLPSRRHSLWHPVCFPRRLSRSPHPPYSRRSQSRPARGRHCHHDPGQDVQGPRLQGPDPLLHLARQAGRQAGSRYQNDSPQEGLGVRQAEAGFLARQIECASQRASALIRTIHLVKGRGLWCCGPVVDLLIASFVC